jgi:hypothetical protein
MQLYAIVWYPRAVSVSDTRLQTACQLGSLVDSANVANSPRRKDLHASVF